MVGNAEKCMRDKQWLLSVSDTDHIPSHLFFKQGPFSQRNRRGKKRVLPALNKKVQPCPWERNLAREKAQKTHEQPCDKDVILSSPLNKMHKKKSRDANRVTTHLMTTCWHAYISMIHFSMVLPPPSICLFILIVILPLQRSLPPFLQPIRRGRVTSVSAIGASNVILS